MYFHLNLLLFCSRRFYELQLKTLLLCWNRCGFQRVNTTSLVHQLSTENASKMLLISLMVSFSFPHLFCFLVMFQVNTVCWCGEVLRWGFERKGWCNSDLSMSQPIQFSFLLFYGLWECNDLSASMRLNFFVTLIGHL